MSVNSKMTAIADEIRVLSGTTGMMGLDAMATNIADANDEVTEQANLIAQLNTALDYLGGTPVEGGSTVETCTVTVTNQNFTMPLAIYTTVENGMITTKVIKNITSGTTSLSCVKGTRMFLSENRGAMTCGLMIMNTNGGVSYEEYTQLSVSHSLITFIINEDGTINMKDDT